MIVNANFRKPSRRKKPNNTSKEELVEKPLNPSGRNNEL